MLTAVFAALLLLDAPVIAPRPLPGATRSLRVGQVLLVADGQHARPGGYVTVDARAPFPVSGSVMFLARRVPFHAGGGGARTRVPVPLIAQPGTYMIGVEIVGRGGAIDRASVPVTVGPAVDRPAETVLIPVEERWRLSAARRDVDARTLLAALRTVSRTRLANGPLLPPVEARPQPTFGAVRRWLGAEGVRVEEAMDAVWGDQHRGMDFTVPVGSPVRAPGAGVVVLADELALSGTTLVIDHGQGLVSLLAHLDAAAVGPGDRVQAGEVVGRSGASGIASLTHVHWGVWLHGGPVDPALFARLDDVR